MSEVALMKIPYPYQAMLAICSDLDETPDLDIYMETIRFLNTKENTSFGAGLGLEVGNSIYFDMPPNQFSYWNTDDRGRAIIRELIHSGHIDCLHSYGDLATTRAHAARALEELSKYNCKLKVWVDHGIASSNFGKDIMQGQGDIIGSKIYHADITTDFGTRYVWLGRVTSVIGQNATRTLRGIWNSRYPSASARTVATEFAKGFLSFGENSKYAMHKKNKILREVQLRSGQKVFEFLRSNPHWRGVSSMDTVEGLGEVLNTQMLECLIKRNGTCILYTHLGKIKNRKDPCGELTKKALGTLAQYVQDGKVLVTTTKRLLDYCRMLREVKISTTVKENVSNINVQYNGYEKDLEGLSLYVDDPEKTRVFINDKEFFDYSKNGADNTGQKSISFPWKSLEFPKL